MRVCYVPGAELSTRSGPKNDDRARLAGVVMAMLGFFTYATTSPFGFVLSLEKLFESNRSPGLKSLDRGGVIFGGAGTPILPAVLYGMWTYSLIGPWPVVYYLTFLAAWVLYRKRFVWPKLREQTDGV